MFRVITIALVLAISTIAETNAQDDKNSYLFRDLRNELSAAKTAPEQLEIIERMREALLAGAVPGRQVSTMIYGLAGQPVFNDPATISFLQQLIATPDTAEATTTAIASQFRNNTFSEQARNTYAEGLRTYHQQQGLSDAAISNLQGALTLDAPAANREAALKILMLRLPVDDKFLTAVSNLLDPKIPLGEKRTAMEVFVKAAETGPLPKHAKTAIYRVATAERDDVVRVAAWPLIMKDRFDQLESERGRQNSLGLNLNKQLIEPETESRPSFVNADEAIREQAVALLNDYWHPEYHADYIEILIRLVANFGSRVSMEKLLELRRINALNHEQLVALSRITTENPAIEESLKAIAIPNLVAGSLVGPVEVITRSNNRKEWVRATEHLLAQYPEGTVPTPVAEAAYRVMDEHDEYDAAAVALFSRGDMSFDAKEAKVLKLVDRTPRYARNIIKALQHLHGDVGLDFLVRRYVSDRTIEKTFRATLITLLYEQVNQSGQLDPETTAAVTDYAHTAESYLSRSMASQILAMSGANVPWSIRVKQRDFQWGILSWVGLLSLVAGVAASVYLLILVALPGKTSGLRGAHRATGFALWLILGLLFVAAVALALLHSIGHNSAPPPDRAFPYYMATMVMAIVLLAVAIGFHRLRSPRSG